MSDAPCVSRADSEPVEPFSTLSTPPAPVTATDEEPPGGARAAADHELLEHPEMVTPAVTTARPAVLKICIRR